MRCQLKDQGGQNSDSETFDALVVKQVENLLHYLVGELDEFVSCL